MERKSAIEEERPYWERNGALLLGVAALGAVLLTLVIFLMRGTAGETRRAEVDSPRAVTPTDTRPEAPTDTHPENAWIEWSSESGPSRYVVAGLQIDLRAGQVEGAPAPVLTVRTAEGAPASVTGTGSGFGAAASFAVVRLDPGGPPHVLMTTFSGGAHCCVEAIVLRPENGGWKRHDLGAWDGADISLPTDLDGDGRREFEVRDDRFLYAFAPYAGSWAPPAILALRDGRVQDLSDRPSFRPVFARYLPEARKACGEGENGACAAYVAAAARLGRVDQAWSFMLDSYDRAADWQYPTGCRLRGENGCPTGAEVAFSGYPEALQWFLGENGYTGRTYLEPLNANGPSFPCARARRTDERAICASSGLSSLDRLMAAAYGRAAAYASDRAALAATQRDFLAERAELSDEQDIAALYEARIMELRAYRPW